MAAQYPEATGNQLIQHLIRNPGGEGEVGRDLEYGYGIISVPKMLASDPAQWPDVNPLIEGLDATAAAGDAGAPAADGGSGDEPADTDAVPVAAAGEDDEGSSAGLLVGGGLIAVLVIGGVVFALARRRSGGSPAPVSPGWAAPDSASAVSGPPPAAPATSVPSSPTGASDRGI